MRAAYLAAAIGALSSWPALAAPPSVISQSFAICDPNNPQNCLAPNATGGLPGGGGSGGGGVALPQGVTTTPFGTPVTANSVSQVRVANSARLYLQFSNETGGDCHIAFGTQVAPSATVGTLFANRAVSTFESSAIDRNALNVFCANSGTITGLEGQ